MRGAFAAAVAVAMAIACAPAYALPILDNTGPDPQPFGTNDVGGFRNVLPPGEAGTDNAVQFATFKASGARPAHWDDQQPLYENLLYASPQITHADVFKYYKDATFGVPAGQQESIEHPRNGVTIVRDKAYGIPHVYGATDLDVEFGAGYAGAEDRLFLMDVLRHTGRAQLSSFAGGSASNREMDRTQWAIAPYTEADLQRQIDLAPTLYGAKGTQLVQRGNAFVDGINAYVDQAMLDPTKLPAEYAAFGQTPTHWKLTDVIAEASLIGGIFGKGGGKELQSAQLLQALEHRYGTKRGKRAWSDFRSKNDPEAPTTVKKHRFPYETTSAFSKRGLALPDRGSVHGAPVAPPVSGASASASSAGSGIGAALKRAATQPPHASNWELVSARHSSNGHAIGVLGPQVGYYDPQILLEEDLHGPGFDARGASFPGVNLMVQLGHGRNFSWSATTATSDNVDTFAEVLCQDDFHYVYKGNCVAMDRLDRTNSWSPSAGDTDDPAGSETLTAYRTVHGIVFARGTVKGKKVAFVTARTTYGHEADSAIGFFCLNDPGCTNSPQTFRKAVDGINFGFNWGYIDSHHIAYQLSGWYPKRAKRTSPDFPILGTGAYDWQGYNTDTHTMKLMSMNQRPHAVDPPFLVSWNNKQAPGWAAADDKFDFGPVFRSEMIEHRVKVGISRGRKMTIQKLVQSMEEPASQDLRVWALLPTLRRVIGNPHDARLSAGLTLLARWAKAGSHRRDLNRDGKDEATPAITLMDAWWPRLVQAEFGQKRALGGASYRALTRVIRQDDVLPQDLPAAPDYDDGWWGFVSKDLRDVLHRRVKGRWSRSYCGGGKRGRCRSALIGSLRSALAVTPQQLYGKGDCASNPDPACSDQNRPTVASAVSMPPFPFQNRPTFQQAVEITK